MIYVTIYTINSDYKSCQIFVIKLNCEALGPVQKSKFSCADTNKLWNNESKLFIYIGSTHDKYDVWAERIKWHLSIALARFYFEMLDKFVKLMTLNETQLHKQYNIKLFKL